MTKIEQYDEDICRLRYFLNQPLKSYTRDGYEIIVGYEIHSLLVELVKREVERLTAERNNLIRLGG